MRQRGSISYFAVISLGLVFSMGVSQCAGVKLDTSKVYANEANDYTALIEGCGLQLNDGFIVCRKTEGDASTEKLTFIAPPAKCLNNTCVSFKVFNQSGDVIYGNAFPKGTTRLDVPWSTILQSSAFELGSRGFWGIVYTITFTGSDNQEHTVETEGEIYLRVQSKSYVPLHDVSGDPNFVWNWKQDGVEVRMTTAGRTHVDKRSN